MTKPARSDVDLTWYGSTVQPEFPPLPVPPPGGWLSDEPPMEDHRHLRQMLALIATLNWLWRDRTDYFASGNLTVYYSPRQRKSEHFRGPDFFVVKNVDGTPERNNERGSWVVWEEGGRYPDVIIELLSKTTEAIDRGEKKDIYEQIWRTPEYFLYDPITFALEGFKLGGGRYQSIVPDGRGLLDCEQLELKLGVHERELRFFFPDGTLVPKPEEDARAERARREQLEAELLRLHAELDDRKHRD